MTRVLSIVLLLLAACSQIACREQSSFVGESKAEPEPRRPQILLTLPTEVAPTPMVRPEFVNVAQDLGISFTFYNDEVEGRFHLPEVMGGGAAWLDYDLDGQLDLFFANGDLLQDGGAPQGTATNHLYRNGGSAFHDVSAPTFTKHGGFGQGCCVGDFDVDGFPDLYVANYGANLLLRNNGDGTYADITETARVSDPLWSTSPVWMDISNDGLLDLYVTNYLLLTSANLKLCDYNGKPGYCGPGDYDAAPDHVFISNGDGTFTESAEALGFDGANGKGLAVAVADFDGDAKPEIYVANDMVENFLYRPVATEVGLRYENVAKPAGCAASGEGNNEASMGVACADFDGDGLLDIFLAHYYTQKNTLYRNLGDMLFEDDSRRTRIAATSFETLGFGTIAFDYDLDGSRDLFVANGHVLGPLQTPNEMQAQLLHNDGTGRFDDISDLAGCYFEDTWLGRGAAGADYDNDGDVDLVVTHLHRPVALLRNDTPRHHHFIGLDLRPPSRLPPLGARVVVTAGGRRQVIPVVGGGSYLSSADTRLVIGLGEWSGNVDVEVFWPTGTSDSFKDLTIDQYWGCTEGKKLDLRVTEDRPVSGKP